MKPSTTFPFIGHSVMTLDHSRGNTRNYAVTIKNTANHRIGPNNTPITQFRSSLNARANSYKTIFADFCWSNHITLIKNWLFNVDIRVVRIGDKNIARYETSRPNVHFGTTDYVKILPYRHIVMDNQSAISMALGAKPRKYPHPPPKKHPLGMMQK
nr:hypothetical protein [Variovorax paradoxus]